MEVSVENEGKSAHNHLSGAGNLIDVSGTDVEVLPKNGVRTTP